MEHDVRLRADFWVAAFLRQHNRDGLTAMLRRRGSPEAGGVYILLDRLDGQAAVFGPAPALDASGSDRQFIRLHAQEWIAASDAGQRLQRESRFDEDIWIIEVESREYQIDWDVVDL